MAAKFEIHKSANGQFFFRLKAGNGEIILASEMYSTKAAAEGGVASVEANAPDDARYERKKSKADEPYFVLTAANGQTIGKNEMYSGASAMENGIKSVKANAPAAEVADKTAT